MRDLDVRTPQFALHTCSLLCTLPGEFVVVSCMCICIFHWAFASAVDLGTNLGIEPSILYVWYCSRVWGISSRE